MSSKQRNFSSHAPARIGSAPEPLLHSGLSFLMFSRMLVWSGLARNSKPHIPLTNPKSVVLLLSSGAGWSRKAELLLQQVSVQQVRNGATASWIMEKSFSTSLYPHQHLEKFLCFIFGGQGSGEKSRRKGAPGMFFHAVPLTQFLSLCSDWPKGHTEISRGLETTFTWQQAQAQICWKPPGLPPVRTENGHRHCHCPLTFSQQSQTEEEFFFFSRRKYWHSSKHRGTRWSRNTAKIQG